MINDVSQDARRMSYELMINAIMLSRNDEMLSEM